MKQFIVTTLLILVFFAASAQKSMIENVRLEMGANNESMIITYDLLDELPASNIQLEVTKEAGDIINAKTISGDYGDNVEPGTNKTIVWNIIADSVAVFGTGLLVQVTCDVPVSFSEVIIKEKRWVPWFYIASGASAAFGTFAHFNAKSIYTGKYLPASTTPDAGDYNTQFKRWEDIRDVAYGTAAVLGGIGVVVHIKHNNKVQALGLNYYPMPQGAQFALTYNF